MSEFFKKRRVVVTGGAGFLGGYVLDGLKKRGCENILVPKIEDYDFVERKDVNRMYTEMYINFNTGRGTAVAVILVIAIIPFIYFNISRFIEQEETR